MTLPVAVKRNEIRRNATPYLVYGFDRIAQTGLRSSGARLRVHQHGRHPDIRGARAPPTLREERGQRCLSHPALRLPGSG